MATLLADRKSAPDAEQTPSGQPGADPQSPPGAPAAAEQRACANCGSPLDASQDWCINCGAGAPGSLGAPTSSWRSGATVLAATAILALGAAAAAYAALSKGKAKPHVVTVAQAPAAIAPGAATLPGATTPTTPASPGTPTTIKPATPGLVKPPKIPLTAVTPKASPTTSTPIPSPPAATTPAKPAPSTGEGTSAPPGEASQPGALLLDTNAAATYNPYAYPATDFGDPSLTIDGDTSTGWIAQVEPTVAPKMAEGLVIDLKSARRLSALALITSTPGMTVQVYGANVPTLPTSITDPAWIKLTPALVEKSKHLRLKLRAPKKSRSLRDSVDQPRPRERRGNPPGSRPREHQRSRTVPGALETAAAPGIAGLGQARGAAPVASRARRVRGGCWRPRVLPGVLPGPCRAAPRRHPGRRRSRR